VSDLERYSEGILYDRSVIETSEELSDFESAGEYLMLRLRTAYGISEQEYYDIYRCDMEFILKKLKHYEENGWAELKDGRWRFTPRGFLLSNVLIAEVLEAQTKQRSEISRPWIAASDAEEPQLTMFTRRPGKAEVW
jgi:oxygen-independent coproporphyrinogen-3 oxidase